LKASASKPRPADGRSPGDELTRHITQFSRGPAIRNLIVACRSSRNQAGASVTPCRATSGGPPFGKRHNRPPESRRFVAVDLRPISARSCTALPCQCHRLTVRAAPDTPEKPRSRERCPQDLGPVGEGEPHGVFRAARHFRGLRRKISLESALHRGDGGRSLLGEITLPSASSCQRSLSFLGASWVSLLSRTRRAALRRR